MPSKLEIEIQENLRLASSAQLRAFETSSEQKEEYWFNKYEEHIETVRELIESMSEAERD